MVRMGTDGLELIIRQISAICLPGRCFTFELRLSQATRLYRAASQSYQLPPVADLLRVVNN